jgi:GNAT superfamily N-acetyltransferase
VIRPLWQVPEARPALVRLMEAEWPNWYGPNGPGEAASDLDHRTRAEGLPWGVTWIEDGPAGAAALAETSHGAGAGEGPWIVGLVVAPGLRGRGIGSALVAACEAQARASGAAAAYATTGAARRLLLRRGWTAWRELGDGQAVLRLAFE